MAMQAAHRVGYAVLPAVLPLALLIAAESHARPVSYPGGYTIMTMSDPIRDTLYMHYSPTSRYALGVEAVDDKHAQKQYAYMRFTWLMHRKNTRTSQRNLYFQSGVSASGLDEHFYGLLGDWETRRLFVGFGYKKTRAQRVQHEEQYAQFGVAPYLGDYGDLHTWLMLKARRATLTDARDTYPLVKFFKGSALAEFGYIRSSDWDVHLMYRF